VKEYELEMCSTRGCQSCVIYTWKCEPVQL